MKSDLNDLIGPRPTKESGFRKRMRFHQGWWRTFVLAESAGQHPSKREQTICNTIRDGRESKLNFLSTNIVAAVQQTITARKSDGKGIIEEERLHNNLLSSQPLAFNFFGELMQDKELACQVLCCFWPEVTEVRQVIFEYAPRENYTNDNSAFDVAFEVMAEDKSGLIGLECKYTDSFSTKAYDKPAYRHIFAQSGTTSFSAPYDELKASRFNQLFRNQLMASALVQNNEYDFVRTGLFFHRDDRKAAETATLFQQMLVDGTTAFKLLSYQDLLANWQQLEIDWELRELTMLLWARYCGNKLSDAAY